MRNVKFTTFAALCAGLAIHLTARPLAEFVEAEANLLVTVQSTSGLAERLPEHPLVKLFEQPAIAKLMKEGAAKEGAGSFLGDGQMERFLEENYDLAPGELLELFPGQIALSLYNVPELVLKQTERPDFLLMAEFAGSAERLEALLQKQFERNAEAHAESNPLVEHELVEETFMGQRLVFDEVFDGEATYIEDGYALVDGLFILATPEERLRAAVEAILEGPEAPLSEDAAYQRFREATPGGDLGLYVNLATLARPLTAALAQPGMAGGLAMMGITGQSLTRALALESMEGFGLELGLTADGMEGGSILLYREKSGLLRLMQYGADGLPEAGFVPTQVLSSSISSFDLSAFFEELEGLLAMASPTLSPLIDIQLQNLKNRAGVDLRAALLQNFGSEMISVSVLPEQVPEGAPWPNPDQLIVIEIKDGALLSGALEALKDQIPGLRAQIEERDFEGQRIHTLVPPTAPGVPQANSQPVSYVVTRSHFYLMVGQVGLLQQALASSQRSDGFWQQAEIVDLFRGIRRPDAVSRSFFDAGQFIGPLLESLRTLQAGATSPVDEVGPIEFPYVLISEMNETGGGLSSRWLLLPAERAMP